MVHTVSFLDDAFCARTSNVGTHFQHSGCWLAKTGTTATRAPDPTKNYSGGARARNQKKRMHDRAAADERYRSIRGSLETALSSRSHENIL